MNTPGPQGPSRALGDYQVDRAQVYGGQPLQPSATNRPCSLISSVFSQHRSTSIAVLPGIGNGESGIENRGASPIPGSRFPIPGSLRRLAADQRAGATPVPIPNTVVKTRSADGTTIERSWESRPSSAIPQGSPSSLRGRASFFERRQRSTVNGNAAWKTISSRGA